MIEGHNIVANKVKVMLISSRLYRFIVKQPQSKSIKQLFDTIDEMSSWLKMSRLLTSYSESI